MTRLGDRYKVPKPFLMGSQEAHDDHKGWYEKQKNASFDRGLRRNIKPVEVDAGGMISWATSWLQRGQDKQQTQKVKTLEATPLEKNFFGDLLDKFRGE